MSRRPTATEDEPTSKRTSSHCFETRPRFDALCVRSLVLHEVSTHADAYRCLAGTMPCGWSLARRACRRLSPVDRRRQTRIEVTPTARGPSRRTGPLTRGEPIPETLRAETQPARCRLPGGDRRGGWAAAPGRLERSARHDGSHGPAAPVMTSRPGRCTRPPQESPSSAARCSPPRCSRSPRPAPSAFAAVSTNTPNPGTSSTMGAAWSRSRPTTWAVGSASSSSSTLRLQQRRRPLHGQRVSLGLRDGGGDADLRDRQRRVRQRLGHLAVGSRASAATCATTTGRPGLAGATLPPPPAGARSLHTTGPSRTSRRNLTRLGRRFADSTRHTLIEHLGPGPGGWSLVNGPTGTSTACSALAAGDIWR